MVYIESTVGNWQHESEDMGGHLDKLNYDLSRIIKLI